jgi:hypothetical protein
MTFVRVTGQLDDAPVWATWENGEVYGDARLLAMARDYVERREQIPIAAGGPFVSARLDEPWSFTVTISSLVDDPIVSGDDLPSVAADRESGERNRASR